ncbi:DUF4360 domain-containing protein [Actinomadura rubrisoli]|uniref:DUF4360 domain-containing protein n=1 Tax=Actinomadura rubrisoli TaxID=2530368 RepID=UPI001FB740CE|nr:DUF4360 domain-containing protein [Actinomadura rubrisoli]
MSAALALPLLSAPSALADEAPPPDNVSIEVVTVNGSGCPPGSANVVISDDKTAFTVKYNDYLAYAGGDTNPTGSRKNCQINVRVNAPGEYTYAITGSDHRGFAGLQDGASGLQQTNYYFQGSTQDRTVQHELNGRYVDDWQFRDRIPANQLVYKPCGQARNLNINTELRVNAGDSDNKVSFMSMDATRSSTTYHFAWKRC